MLYMQLVAFLFLTVHFVLCVVAARVVKWIGTFFKLLLFSLFFLKWQCFGLSLSHYYFGKIEYCF